MFDSSMALYLTFVALFFLETVYASFNIVILTNNGPAVRGSNVTFVATVLSDYSGQEFKFIFSDDGGPLHYKEILSTERSVNYTAQYEREKYDPGKYKVTVNVKQRIASWIDAWEYFGRNNTDFYLTESLNGNLILSQNETVRPNNFVAVNNPVHHFVKIPDSDMEFLNENSSSIVVHWLIDCELVETTTDYFLNYTYSDVMSSHDVEAIVVANNEPRTTTTTTTTMTTTTTTSTTTTTTTPKPTTTPLTTTTSPKPNTTSTTPPNTSTSSTIAPKELPVTSPITTPNNKTEDINTSSDNHKVKKRAISNRTVRKGLKSTESFACHHNIPIGVNYTYGRYQQTIKVREPISTINITGMDWLQHGDLLNMVVKYSGSPPFNYCIQYKLGEYNITGHETCEVKTSTISNTFPLVHYFSDSEQHTVVVILENDIGKRTATATINIYKVTVNPQLSVIVVPVFFCSVAVILVVFGIAYYQHRTRHTVEVADFDFGQAHLDYKTFTERLRDSFRNAFDFRQRDDTEALTSNTRYDSMT